MQAKSRTGFRGLTGTTIIDADILNVDNIEVDDLVVTNSIDISNATLSMTQVDNSTIEFAANQLKIKDLGVSTAKIADNAITNSKITSVDGSKITNNIPESVRFYKTSQTGSTIRFDMSSMGNTASLVFKPVVSVLTQTINIPSQTNSDMVLTTGSQTLLGKSFTDSSCSFIDNSDSTKKMLFECSGITTATTRTLTIPNANGTILLDTAAQTITNKQIAVTQLTGQLLPTQGGTGSNNPLAATISLVGALSTSGVGAYACVLNLSGNTSCYLPLSGTCSTLAGSETLTNKTLTTPIITSLISSGATITMPTSSDTLSTLALPETLTNKTLTTPIITSLLSSGATITMPTSTAQLSTLALAESLSNKSLQDASCNFVDDVDSTKKVGFTITSATTNTKSTLRFNQTANRTITFPDISDTLITDDSASVLQNKILVDTSTKIVKNSFSTEAYLLFDLSSSVDEKTTTIKCSHTNDRIITLPNATDTLVGKSTTDLLTNKQFSDSTVSIVNVSDNSKAAIFSLGSATANKTLTLISSHTDNRSITFPDQTGTLSTTVGANSTGWVLLETLTASGSSAVFTHSAITSSYNNLKMVFNGRHGAGTASCYFTVNAVASGYDYYYVYGNSGGAATSASAANQANIPIGHMPASLSSPGNITIKFPNYKDTNWNKHFVLSAGFIAQATANSRYTRGNASNRSTTAISSIELTSPNGNWLINSTCMLYGSN